MSPSNNRYIALTSRYYMEHTEGLVQNYCNYLILYKKLQ